MFAIHLNALYRVIPTKWRSYRDHRLCDVISPYMYIHFAKALITSASSRNHNPHQNCLNIYFSTLRITSQIQDDSQTAKSHLISQNFSINLFLSTCQHNMLYVIQSWNSLPATPDDFSSLACFRRFLQRTNLSRFKVGSN